MFAFSDTACVTDVNPRVTVLNRRFMRKYWGPFSQRQQATALISSTLLNGSKTLTSIVRKIYLKVFFADTSTRKIFGPVRLRKDIMQNINFLHQVVRSIAHGDSNQFKAVRHSTVWSTVGLSLEHFDSFGSIQLTRTFRKFYSVLLS